MTRTSEKLTFTNAAGEELAARLERPAGEPLGWAVFAHCFTCSKDGRAATRVGRALAERGWAVLRFDFTGLGNSEGDFGRTNLSSNVDDLVAAAQELTRQGGAPTLLVGHSLGGAAVIAASRRLPSVKAIATIGAPSDPAHVEGLLADAPALIEEQGEADVQLGGRTFRLQRQFLEDLRAHSLTEILAASEAALMLFHSPLDNIVGIDHAQTLFEAARHPKSFVSLDGADHMLSDAKDAEMVAGVLASWAARFLDAPATEPDSEAPTGPSVGPGEVLVSEGSQRHAQNIVAGAHTLVADEPVSVGGRDAGPTPYDLLLSALGACTTMTLRMYADHKGWPLDHVAVRLKHDRIHAQDCETCESETGKVSRIERELHIEGDLDDDQRARLLEIADRCPVHRTITHEKQMVTRLAAPVAAESHESQETGP